jgi:hypothetical protein
MVLCGCSFPNSNRSCHAYATLRRKVTMLWKFVDCCRRKVARSELHYSSLTNPPFNCSKPTLTGILFSACEPTTYLWHTARTLCQSQRFFFRGSASWCVTEHPLTTAVHLFAKVTMERKGISIKKCDSNRCHCWLETALRTAGYFLC